MASPVGHALVGLGLAAAVAHTTGTPDSSALWLGAVVASGLPDLDLIGAAFGLPSRSAHRYATHSVLVLGALVLAAAWVWTRLPAGVDPGLGLAWAAALFSHPLLDLVSTGPATAARGHGIALLWPLSSRRWFLQRPILSTVDLTACRSVVEAWKAIGSEIYCLGPASVVLILLGYFL